MNNLSREKEQLLLAIQMWLQQKQKQSQQTKSDIEVMNV